MSKKYIALTVFIAILVGLRLVLPVIIRDQANKEIANIPGHQGRVGNVHLALWRGALALNDFDLRHTAGDLAIHIDRLEISVKWSHLFHKNCICNVVVQNPRLTLVVSKPTEIVSKAKDQWKDAKEAIERNTGKSLPAVIADLIPFRIDRFNLENGEFILSESDQHAQKDDKQPQKDPLLTDLNIEVTNLTNSGKVSNSLIAEGKLKTKIMGAGNVNMTLHINPFAKEPKFNMLLEVQKLNLVSLNDVMEWQTGLKFKQGTFALYSEISAADGAFKGYIKPFIDNLKVDNPEENPSLVQKAKKVIANVAAKLFENEKTEEVATKIPLEGRFDNPHADIWEAVVELLRNAFIQSLKPRLDPSIHFTNT